MKTLDKYFTCPHCGHKFFSEYVSIDELGWHTSCPECGGSFDIDVPSGRILMAITDPDTDDLSLRYRFFTDRLVNTSVFILCTYDNPLEFLADWRRRMEQTENHIFDEVGMWYWLYDEEHLICYGGMSPDDEEIFFEYWDLPDEMKIYG